MTAYLLIFLAGLAGSMHCVGMCGGFACALGPDRRGPLPTLHRQLVYNIGRVTSYCFLGALVGHLGMVIVGHDGHAALSQRLLAVISGLLMVYIGLQFFGYFRRGKHAGATPGEAYLARALQTLLKAPGFGAPLAFGVLNGFLPCPLVYAFAAQAAASGDSLSGVLTMGAFGLGTFPAMLAMGGIGVWFRSDATKAGRRPIAVDSAHRAKGAKAKLRADWRQYGVRIAGGFIVLLGFITFARGVLPITTHFHGL